ncbi:effector binding domain-containing protein [Paenibacillus alkalitolerans]|uniref:effector binding domain-containing protein n=1 Tax=Paenibacillus alkalitolerans TaxID=2799335 RepID=UPI0018F6B2DF|nr:effector binding domain-containing protein [Paenibacillus alkalitolerans]
MLENMKPYIVKHDEMKLIGIPCIGLNEMGSKYRHAKEGLLSASKYLPNVVNRNVHYGVCPQTESQDNPETHAYLLCVEVDSFEGIPEWFFKTVLPQREYVAVANNEGNWDEAGSIIDRYVQEKGLKIGAGSALYIIGERYRYEEEGFARYAPIVPGVSA